MWSAQADVDNSNSVGDPQKQIMLLLRRVSLLDIEDDTI